MDDRIDDKKDWILQLFYLMLIALVEI